jgi:hypothetical protein
MKQITMISVLDDYISASNLTKLAIYNLNGVI